MFSAPSSLAAFFLAATSTAAQASFLPANDPSNASGWVVYEPLSDEFDGDSLDTSKWSTDQKKLGWPGRQPGLFDASNVVVGDGLLTMYAKAAAWPNASFPPGYGNFTTCAVHSVNRTAQGMFEIRSRSGNSPISSSFWFHENDGNGTWTEIDVFESMGQTNNSTKWGMNSSLFCSHTHFFEFAGVNQSDLPEKCGCKLQQTGECSLGSCTPMPFEFDGDFHIFGLEWNASLVTYYADGVAVQSMPAQCLTQNIGMDFDRETMPDWMGLPPSDGTFAEDQPFEVDYVRAWKSTAV